MLRQISLQRFTFWASIFSAQPSNSSVEFHCPLLESCKSSDGFPSSKSEIWGFSFLILMFSAFNRNLSKIKGLKNFKVKERLLKFTTHKRHSETFLYMLKISLDFYNHLIMCKYYKKKKTTTFAC